MEFFRSGGAVKADFLPSRWYFESELGKTGCAPVLIVPLLQDNYGYLIVDRASKTAVAVDPVEPVKVLKACRDAQVELDMILCTHKHADHSGGNRHFQSSHPRLKIYGSSYEATPGITNELKHNDVIKFQQYTIKALHTPCHTRGHLLYYVSREDSEGGNPFGAPMLFSGDTLFFGGCGRFFEGTPADMNRALNKVILHLPEETLVYCGHEYTSTNLNFAFKMEPTNPVLPSVMQYVSQQRAKGLPTIPSTILEESHYNPFMRLNKPSIRATLGASYENSDEVTVMQKLRELKDDFRD